MIILYHEQVLETARHVASLPVSSTPIPYDQVKSQCEALVNGKQQKMLALQSFKVQQEAKAILSACENENKGPVLSNKVKLPSSLSLCTCFASVHQLCIYCHGFFAFHQGGWGEDLYIS